MKLFTCWTGGQSHTYLYELKKKKPPKSLILVSVSLPKLEKIQHNFQMIKIEMPNENQKSLFKAKLKLLKSQLMLKGTSQIRPH